MALLPRHDAGGLHPDAEVGRYAFPMASLPRQGKPFSSDFNRPVVMPSRWLRCRDVGTGISGVWLGWVVMPSRWLRFRDKKRAALNIDKPAVVMPSRWLRYRDGEPRMATISRRGRYAFPVASLPRLLMRCTAVLAGA